MRGTLHEDQCTILPGMINVLHKNCSENQNTL